MESTVAEVAPSKSASFNDWFPEPDNIINQQYYETELDFSLEGSPFVLSTWNQSLHEHMVMRGQNAINACRFKKRGAVIELMSGCGRNYQLLSQYFSRVEMLERN